VRGEPPQQKPVLDAEGLKRLFAMVDRIHLPVPVADYIGRLVEATHSQSASAPDGVKRFVRYGASPRAALAMASSARAAALMKGKPNVGFDEVRDVTMPVLNHRLVLSYEAGLEKVTADKVVNALLEAVPEVARG
jgi:MoxR-like ATPase